MEALIIFGAGGAMCLLIAGWLGVNSLRHVRMYRRFAGADRRDVSSLEPGDVAYVTGELAVTEPADDPFGEASDERAVGLGSWRLERRRSTSDRGSGYAMIDEGVAAGEFDVADETGSVAVDATWTVANHHSPGADHDVARSPIDTPYLYLSDRRLREREGVAVSLTGASLSRKRFSDPVVRFLHRRGADAVASLGEYRRNPGSKRRFEYRSLEDGDAVTVAGRVDVDRGTVTLTGDDDVPLVIADCEASEIESRIGKKLLFNAVLWAISLSFAVAIAGVISLELLAT